MYGFVSNSISVLQIFANLSVECDRPVDQHLVATRDGVIVHNVNIHSVQLIFDPTGIVRIPVILHPNIGIGVIYCIRKSGNASVAYSDSP